MMLGYMGHGELELVKIRNPLGFLMHGWDEIHAEGLASHN